MFPELRLVGFAAVDDAGRSTPSADQVHSPKRSTRAAVTSSRVR